MTNKMKDKLLEILNECSENFLKRIKSQGFNSVKEFEKYHFSFYPSINRYPVNSDY